MRDDLADDPERVLVVFGEMIGDARDTRVHVGAAKLFGRDDFAGRGFDERRSA